MELGNDQAARAMRPSVIGSDTGHALLVAAAFAVSACTVGAQDAVLSCRVRGSYQWLSSRPSPLDSAVLVISGVTAKICYSRPSARGRSVFDSLAPFGKIWRTGANEPTTLLLSAPLDIGGAPLTTGRYVMLSVPGPQEWLIVFYTTPATDAAEMFQTLREVARGRGKAERLDVPVEQFTIRGNAERSGAELLFEWGPLRVRVPVRTPQ